MNEEFDDSVKSHITNVFDNFEDDSAHEGWLLLREKYPEEKRRSIAWLWWALAAILLVFLSIGIWLNNGSSVINKPKSIVNTQTVKKHIDPVFVDHHRFDVKQSRPQLASQTRQNNAISRQVTLNGDKRHIGKQLLHQVPAITNKHNGGEQIKPKQLPVNKPVDSHEALARVQNQVEANILLPVTGADSTQRDNNLQNDNPVAKLAPDAMIKPEIKQLQKAMRNVQKADAAPDLKQPVDKRVKFGVYAATYFNYAKGSDNEFNVGAGISSEIKLSGNLKLITGVAISQNSLNYNTNTTIPKTANDYLVSTLTTQNRNFLAAADLSNSHGIALSSYPATPVLKNYQASLIGLDIPVNLKYQFGKTDSYISAGVSSGTYVNETYQYVYNYSNPIVATQDNNTKSQSNFSTFDFAKTLNVSFGMGYPLGKTNRLIIEPFLKYPLNGLGAQQIRFGAGGIILKFNFQSSKN